MTTIEGDREEGGQTWAAQNKELAESFQMKKGSDPDLQYNSGKDTTNFMKKEMFWEAGGKRIKTVQPFQTSGMIQNKNPSRQMAPVESSLGPQKMVKQRLVLRSVRGGKSKNYRECEPCQCASGKAEDGGAKSQGRREGILKMN